MTNLSTTSYIDGLLEQIKNIDTENISDDIVVNPKVDTIEEQIVYFWVRLFLKEEEPNLEIGDDIYIEWTPSGEKLRTKFICYAKSGSDKDNGYETAHYNTEDDKKTLCLMIDEKQINYNDDIPFIRTLFRTGRHFQYQLVKRDELLFIIDKNNIILDYYDTSF